MRLFNKLLNLANPDLSEDDSQSGLISGEDDAPEGELALDVYQSKDNLVIKSTMAGVKPEDLDITIADDQVVIKGERKEEREAKEEDYLMQECYWGSFYRAFALPVEVDVDKAIADIKDGILTITIPKAARARTKKVKVKQAAEEEE